MVGAGTLRIKITHRDRLESGLQSQYSTAKPWLLIITHPDGRIETETYTKEMEAVSRALWLTLTEQATYDNLDASKGETGV
jgi:hypothetical protein